MIGCLSTRFNFEFQWKCIVFFNTVFFNMFNIEFQWGCIINIFHHQVLVLLDFGRLWVYVWDWGGNRLRYTDGMRHESES
jgi:hypothetical protein